MRLALLLLFLPFFNGVFANDSTQTFDHLLKSFRTITISSRWIKPNISKKIINDLQVIDLRVDKDRLGMYSNDSYNPVELVLPENQTFENLLKEKLVDEKVSGHSILMVLQNLWLTDIFPQKISGSQYNTSKVVARIDLFIKQDEKYIALTRLDTTIWNRNKVSYSANSLMESLIETINDKIEKESSTNNLGSRKRLDKQFLQEYYSKKIAFSVTENAVKKGVYFTADDFRKNNPSSTDFRIEAGRTEPAAIYLKDEKGNEYYTRNIWGVNDGMNTYIMQDGLLFKLYKNGNAFYWFGVKNIKAQAVGVPIGIPLGGGWGAFGIERVTTIVKYRLTPYLLDLEKGVAY